MNPTVKQRPLNTIGANPFIGFQGKGSDITVTDTGSVITVRQSVWTLLYMIIMLGLLGPGLTVLTFVEWHELRTRPMFAIVALAFGVLVGWFAFVRYFLIAVGRQRLEYRKADRSLHMRSWNGKVLRIVRHSELESLFIRETYYRSKGPRTTNYTLTLKESDGGFLDLVTSDKEDSIRNLKSLLTSDS